MNRVLRSIFGGAIVLAALLFLPAGTLDYWQAWIFAALFLGSSTAMGIYLAIKDPKLFKRRMNAGPTAEKEKTQKIIMVFAVIGFITLLVFPALDHRFAWSPVPSYVSVSGDVLIALGFFVIFLVLKENSYGASTIQIAEDHKVITTGPYALVRHPMYAGTVVWLVGVPLALGSWCGLFLLAFIIPVLVWRLLEEEKFLHKNLPGYREYTKKVQDRLVPFLW